MGGDSVGEGVSVWTRSASGAAKKFGMTIDATLLAGGSDGAWYGGGGLVVLLPGGFPVGHPRFWVNEALPILVLAMVVAVRFLVWSKERVRNSIWRCFRCFGWRWRSGGG